MEEGEQTAASPAASIFGPHIADSPASEVQAPTPKCIALGNSTAASAQQCDAAVSVAPARQHIATEQDVPSRTEPILGRDLTGAPAQQHDAAMSVATVREHASMSLDVHSRMKTVLRQDPTAAPAQQGDAAVATAGLHGPSVYDRHSRAKPMLRQDPTAAPDIDQQPQVQASSVTNNAFKAAAASSQQYDAGFEEALLMIDVDCGADAPAGPGQDQHASPGAAEEECLPDAVTPAGTAL